MEQTVTLFDGREQSPSLDSAVVGQVVRLPNRRLQQLNATRFRSEVGLCRDVAGCARGLLAPVIRSTATLAFDAERLVVGQTRMSDGSDSLTLAGYFAAHGMWSVVEGDIRAPFIGSAAPDGSPRLDAFEADDYGAAVANAREAFRFAEAPAVLVYDGYASLPTGRTDALFLHVRTERAGEDLDIVLPYRSAKHPDGFAVHRPKFGASNLTMALEEQAACFFRGVGLHEEGARIWEQHLDETV